MSLFDISKPGAKVIRSPMGGGWIVPLTEDGTDTLERYFDEPASALAPLGGAEGYIVEPHDAGALAEYLIEAGVAWVVDPWTVK